MTDRPVRPPTSTPASRRPTLSDVAAAAGVSLSTASLTFSGAKPVSGATRDRVLAAAARLGYAGPDPTASSLRRGRSGIVGVVVEGPLSRSFRDPVLVALLDGLAATAVVDGSGLLLLDGDHDGSGPSDRRLARTPLDAVVFADCGADLAPGLGELRRRGVPMVGVEGPHEPDVVLVDVDHRGGVARLASMLRDLGHSRVETLTMPLRRDGRAGPIDAARRAACAYHDVRERWAGVEDVYGPVAGWEVPVHDVEQAREVAYAALDRPTDRRPTALVAQSDLMAIGAILAAHDHGLEVPRDLSVTGFDGIETPWLEGLTLTTVEQPMVDKGRVAGRAVTALLAGERPDDVVLPVQVRAGTTCAPPAT